MGLSCVDGQRLHRSTSRFLKRSHSRSRPASASPGCGNRHAKPGARASGEGRSTHALEAAQLPRSVLSWNKTTAEPRSSAVYVDSNFPGSVGPCGIRERRSSPPQVALPGVNGWVVRVRPERSTHRRTGCGCAGT